MKYLLSILRRSIPLGNEGTVSAYSIFHPWLNIRRWTSPYLIPMSSRKPAKVSHFGVMVMFLYDFLSFSWVRRHLPRMATQDLYALVVGNFICITS